MPSLNRVTLMGHLGKDPEIKYVGEGTAVCKFSIATSQKYKGVEKTEWHNIVCWSKTAEIASQYLRKGSLVLIEGRITTNTWQNDEGVKQYRTEIVVSQLHLMPNKQSGGNPSRKPTEEEEELGAPLDYDDNYLNPS